MWIRTDNNELLNLDCVRGFHVKTEDDKAAVCAWLWADGVGRDDSTLRVFTTTKAQAQAQAQAQAAMDKLEKWIATNGAMYGEPYAPTQVFSFRTLSEDDEF